MFSPVSTQGRLRAWDKGIRLCISLRSCDFASLKAVRRRNQAEEKQNMGNLLTRPTSPHSIDESSLDRSVVTSIDESSLDRRVLTRRTSPHSTDESSLDRRVLTRPTSPHSTDESSFDRRVLTRPTSPHSIDESSLDRSVVTSIDESSLGLHV
ncbi:hypothetical protein DY000_02012064 [Brassica cretica]|uniref:Uncharacterized protein n=1 Tax=Brassica cretica TaxID=69181 RepID=A0ABQ7DDS2_BRACR|nr:hypothetical protein DY000_02012064 [Brassica cretica]